MKKRTVLLATLLFGASFLFCGCGGDDDGGGDAPADISGYWDVVLDFGSGYTADYYFLDLEQSGTTLSGEFSGAYDLDGSYNDGSIRMNAYDPLGDVVYSFEGTATSSGMSGTAYFYFLGSTDKIDWKATR
jgi:hypothetical protein